MNSNSSQRGTTLLELMLAMALASLLLLMGIRFWTAVSFSQNVQTAADNVEGIFLGMRHYYQAFCRQQVDASGTLHGGGALDPVNLDLTKTAYNIDVGTLLSDGFFDNFHNVNPVVDTSQGHNGFFAYFMRVPLSTTAGNYSTYSCTGVSSSSTTPGIPTCATNSTIVLLDGTTPVSQNSSNVGNTNTIATSSYQWVVQVVVALSSTLSASDQTAFCFSINAPCLVSTAPTTTAPAACGTNTCTSTGPYLVFQRAVSALNITSSDSWAAEAYIKSFNQQYTSDTNALFNGISMDTDTGKTLSDANYLCGQ